MRILNKHTICPLCGCAIIGEPEKHFCAPKNEILNTYKWIKVKKFTDDPSLSWEERFKMLEEHHKEETEFLINKIREIVK